MITSHLVLLHIRSCSLDDNTSSLLLSKHHSYLAKIPFLLGTVKVHKSHTFGRVYQYSLAFLILPTPSGNTSCRLLIGRLSLPHHGERNLRFQ